MSDEAKPKALRLKPQIYCQEDECHAVRCHLPFGMVLEQKSAAIYDRDRVLLCDKHYGVHCET